jgi:hypothetical protein
VKGTTDNVNTGCYALSDTCVGYGETICDIAPQGICIYMDICLRFFFICKDAFIM